MTRTLGTYVISWSQTELDGLSGAPVAALEIGANWKWTGDAVRVDGPSDVLLLNDPVDDEFMRQRASRAVRRLMGNRLPPVRAQHGSAFDDPLLERSFVITDGRKSYTVTLIEVAELSRPLLMFLGHLPPRNTELWVVSSLGSEGHFNRITDTPTGVICFTPGTRLRTPAGDKLVEEMVEGEAISTKDGGAQEIVWIGQRRMSGARLYAMPELRPIRIQSGALGDDDPQGDLVVSPRHRVLVKGDVARDLFNTDEVLVAAEDLTNDRTIARDHAMRQVAYIHLLLPRHHVVWANGVETESFHPASASFETIEDHQRARLLAIVPGMEDDPLSYGAPARRELTRSEAAILAHEGRVAS
ncbi:MAG: Hint domain-containing protein [Alphaproteobacteria bacterium]|nr:Hint domain-containing protein [Alphaproteobacteria bacterium]